MKTLVSLVCSCWPCEVPFVGHVRCHCHCVRMVDAGAAAAPGSGAIMILRGRVVVLKKDVMGEEAPDLFLIEEVRTHRAARTESRTRAGRVVSALPSHRAMLLILLRGRVVVLLRRSVEPVPLGWMVCHRSFTLFFLFILFT
jgi:hypothetical protein